MQAEDSTFTASWGLAFGAAGAIVHRVRAVATVTLSPASGGGDRDIEALRSPAQRPLVVNDTAGQTKSAGRGQRRVTVGHEGLRETVRGS